MFAKLVRHGREEALVACQHATRCAFPVVVDNEEDAPEGVRNVFARYGMPFGYRGFAVEVSPGPTWVLPRDGDVVYLMNDNGDTVDSWRWVDRVAVQEAAL